MACSVCRPTPVIKYQPVAVAAMSMGRSQHSRIISDICRCREVVFTCRSMIRPLPKAVRYSALRPVRPKNASICAAMSAARWMLSISQNTRSSGSVPENRLTTQPPSLK